MQQNLVRFSFLVLTIVASVAPVLAGDGVLEINQACAVNTGCFAGDSAGYPVSIGSGGSYQLTGDLIVPDENTTAIDVTTTANVDVNLDLNGFSIVGPTTCSGSPVTSCTPTGSGSGIRSFGGGIRVTNGTIRGMGSWGLELFGVGTRVEQLTTFNNGGRGISTAGSHSLVTGCSAGKNGSYGIFVGFGSMVTDNIVRGNDLGGIYSAGGSTIRSNTVYGNDGVGIELLQGSSAVGNTVYANTGFGMLIMGAGSGYVQNSINSNTGGTVSGGVSMGVNVCDGGTTCP